MYLKFCFRLIFLNVCCCLIHTHNYLNHNCVVCYYFAFNFQFYGIFLNAFLNFWFTLIFWSIFHSKLIFHIMTVNRGQTSQRATAKKTLLKSNIIMTWIYFFCEFIKFIKSQKRILFYYLFNNNNLFLILILYCLSNWRSLYKKTASSGPVIFKIH